MSKSFWNFSTAWVKDVSNLGKGSLGIYTDGSHLISGGMTIGPGVSYALLTKLESSTGNLVTTYKRTCDILFSLYKYIHAWGTKVLAVH